jgi:hypothetical protein
MRIPYFTEHSAVGVAVPIAIGTNLRPSWLNSRDAISSHTNFWTQKNSTLCAGLIVCRGGRITNVILLLGGGCSTIRKY